MSRSEIVPRKSHTSFTVTGCSNCHVLFPLSTPAMFTEAHKGKKGTKKNKDKEKKQDASAVSAVVRRSVDSPVDEGTLRTQRTMASMIGRGLAINVAIVLAVARTMVASAQTCAVVQSIDCE
jgi:hypothetical protein